MRTIRTKQARRRFLAALAQSANVTDACRRAGISRRAAYDWREADPQFAKQWDDALNAAVDALEREAWRRAVKGFEGRPVTYRGRVVTHVREYSDRMLELLLKAHRPEKYSERLRQEVSGREPLEVVIRDLTRLTDDELETVLAQGEANGQRRDGTQH